MLKTALARGIPKVLFMASVLLAMVFAGMYIQRSHVFPFHLLLSAYKTAAINFHVWRDNARPSLSQTVALPQCEAEGLGFPHSGGKYASLPRLLCPTRIPREAAATARVEFLAGGELAEPVLVTGAIGAFLDHCAAPWGCLAVEYSRSGSVRRTWPIRPEEIADANIAEESKFPYEHPLGWSFSQDLKGVNPSPYPNGDLLVVFHFRNSHPGGGGVARVGPDGLPRWYRKDYSHHAPHVVTEDMALVPGTRLHRYRVRYEISRGPRSEERHLVCHHGMIEEDQVHVLNGAGDVLEEIPILDAIIESAYAGILVGADGCDPIHLNFVHFVSEDVEHGAIARGDLVASLRGLSAFGIFDADDRRLKRLVRGSWHMQHHVLHLSESRFVMFDNLGTDGAQGPSRLLVVDLATGEETTVFPNDATPKNLRNMLAVWAGMIDVSADRRRVLMVDRFAGRAFEIRLSDGVVLNVFHHIHDVSSLPWFSETEAMNAWLFEFPGIQYVDRWK